MSILDAMTLPGMNENWGGSVGNTTNQLNRQLGPMRALRYLRPAMASTHSSRMNPRSNNPFMPSMGEQDLSGFTYDPQANARATSMLAPYGERPLNPNEVNPFAVVPNNQFFQNHPKLGGAIDGAITGLASTEGASTWGEGFSNVAKGLIQGRQLHQQMLEQQFAAPFQRASMLEDMQSKQQTMDTNQAHEQYWNAMAQKALHPPQAQSKYKHFFPQSQVDGSVHLMGVKDDDSQVDQGQMYTKPSATPGLAPYLGFFKARGVDPDKANDAQWRVALKDKENYDVKVAGGRRDAVINANANNPNAPALPEPPEIRSARAQLKSDLTTFGSSKYRDQAMQAIVQDQVANHKPIKLPSAGDIDDYVKTKVQARQKEFNDLYDAYSANNPKPNTPKRIVNYNPETQDFDAISDEDQ